ncbi:hypothetical protein SASPL_117600 [Salvia splendens]|uniref:IST1-like protein n=1 Tax=Salvia splendens TaxID=180675 RepID=A0A8X8Y0V6_SALSN|nr:hypothetical protein SASPL_117600 [Salvia splendens]
MKKEESIYFHFDDAARRRLKLLRNKKEAQVNQMRREISVLLESGQDQTARIRVEHVIREDKMMAAFDLIRIYCQLIVARLPIIESQNYVDQTSNIVFQFRFAVRSSCPVDLKDAIASLVYASPRCGDVPELVEMLDKLSVLAPDGETKTKILRTIAEEHNVKWEPKSFEQNNEPASDLLSGPTTFVKESDRLPEPSRNNQLHDSTLHFTQADHRTSPGAERPVSPQVSGFNSGGERKQFFQGDSNNGIPRDGRKWNMNFTDATSAAQATAESAELASMAARAI